MRLVVDIHVNCVCVSYYEQISSELIAPRVLMRTSQNEDYQLRKEELVSLMQKMEYGEWALKELQDHALQSRKALKEQPPLEILDFFSNFTRELVFLFLNLLLENSVVIVGEQVYQVSETIFLLLELIKPIRWVNIMIASLPHELIDILHSPIPFLVGIVDHSHPIHNHLRCTITKNTLTVPMDTPEATSLLHTPQFKQLLDDCLTAKHKGAINLLTVF